MNFLCVFCYAFSLACVGNLTNFLVKLNLVLRNDCVVAFVRIMILVTFICLFLQFLMLD